MKAILRNLALAAAASLLAAVMAGAQTAVGEWMAYQSFGDASGVESHGNMTFCLSNGNLYSFDTDDGSVTPYNRVNLLNGNKASVIGYGAADRVLVVVYDDGNIDLVEGAERTYNIADLMQSTSITDKGINDITVSGHMAYLVGDFGICLLNLERREIANTYLFEYSVLSVAECGGKLFAATDDGVYAGDMSDNLLDRGNWQLVSVSLMQRLATTDDGSLYAIDGAGLYRWDGAGQFVTVSSGAYTILTTDGDRAVVGSGNVVTVVGSDGHAQTFDIGRPLSDISCNSSTGTYWFACGGQLLNGYSFDGASLSPEYTSIAPEGPRHELFYFMKFFGTDLYIAGGMLNYPDVFNPGTVMRYSGGRWTYLDENISSITGISYYNTTSVALDPADASHIFASSSFGGLYEFRDDKFVNLYTYYADPAKYNSSLTSVLPNSEEPRLYVRVDGLNYDRYGNLWMVNSGSQNIINVMKSDGSWRSFDHREIADAPTVDRMLIDSAGRIWITIRRGIKGLFCFDYAGTVDDTSDDHTKYISAFVNQDGDNNGSLAVYAVAEDRDGAIWVGTERGPYIINNPSRIFIDGTPQLTQVKVPRNDGTNLADFLLANEAISAIVVDGANRKWLGTHNTGLYLLSPDGLEMIEHFTTDNSPLFSNYIQSLAMNPETGELFIGTDRGLLSYRTDSSEPEAEFSESVYAFPNPVEPGYQGLVSVTGLVYDTDVKITDTAGRVIATGRSNGGTFSWDCRDAYGREVATGVYMVVASDPEGKNGIVTKITVIR